MTKFFKYSFAVDGEQVDIPDLSQPSGVVSYQAGYPILYSADSKTDPDAKKVERNKFNNLLFSVTDVLQDYQFHTIPPYITPAQYGTVDVPVPCPYAKYAFVRYDDGDGEDIFQSLDDANIDLPSVTASWKRLGVLGANNYTVETLTASDTFVVPNDVLKIYASGVAPGGGAGGSGGVTTAGAYGASGGASAGGGGGGSGDTAYKVPIVVVPGETLTITIGAAGTAGAAGASGANNGGAGGTGGDVVLLRGVTELLHLFGGAGGLGSVTPAGGVGITPGGVGGLNGGTSGSLGFYGTDGVLSGNGGNGGNCTFGVGGIGGILAGGGSTGHDGSNGVGFGSGGGGGGGAATTPASSAARAGGAGGVGAPGLFIIEY